jgi:hypothetical protein
MIEPSIVVMDSVGAYRKVKNLGWLLRHWRDVQSFTIAPYLGLTPWCDATLFAWLRDGTWYATPFASRTVLLGFLNRPVFRTLPIRDWKVNHAE